MGKRVVATKSVLNYTWVSMVAEIGGYVGLLLGIAVVDIVFAMDRIWPMVFKPEKLAATASKKGAESGGATEIRVAPVPEKNM